MHPQLLSSTIRNTTLCALSALLCLLAPWSTASASILIEAESEPGDLSIATNVGGFTGAGFVEIPEGAVASYPITVDAGMKGLYQVEIRYALPPGVNSVDVDVRVDGINGATSRLIRGALGIWAPRSTHFKLEPGPHTVSVRVVGLDASKIALLLDSIQFSMTPPDQNRFLEFPKSVNAKFFTGSAQNTEAYYNTVDPSGERLTFAKWKELNGFTVSGVDVFNENDPGSAHATYQNIADLNLGRDMYVYKMPNGDVASYVQNYGSVEDAISQTNLIATVAMEYRNAASTPGAPRFTTFYVYDANGTRIPSIDLDGRGEKFVPALCNSCHGGKPKTFIPAPGGGLYQHEGDTGAQWIPWDLDNFRYATAKPRALQEAQLRKLNRLTLCTSFKDNAGTPVSGSVSLVRGWYGDPNADCDAISANNFNGDYVPPAWQNTPEHAELYSEVVAPSCRSCHSQRGSFNNRGGVPFTRGPKQRSLEFRTFNEFEDYKDEIEDLVFDQGMMPAAKVTFDNFWRSDQPIILDNVLFGGLAHQNPPSDIYSFNAEFDFGVRRKPGRPLAVVGARTSVSPPIVYLPPRVVPGELQRLNSLPSAFAETARWLPASGTSVSGIPTSDRLATYLSGASLGQTESFNLSVTNTFASYNEIERVTTGTTFSSALQEVVFNDTDPNTENVYDSLVECLLCHSNTAVSQHADTIFNLRDVQMTVDDSLSSLESRAFMYRQVVSRLDCRDPLRSLILSKPAGLRHFDGAQTNFQPGQSNYERMQRWILTGARFDLAESVTAPGSDCRDDGDNDSVYDHDDNCPLIANSNQADDDDDGTGNACESDSDSDGIIDDLDNCRDTPNAGQEDTNGDGIGDLCQPTLSAASVEDVVVDESDGTATARVVLSMPTPTPASIKIHTTAGTAQVGQDYYGFSTELFFAAGDTEQLVPLSIINDSVVEGAETYGLRLFAENGLTISRRLATVTINDDDVVSTPPSVIVLDATVDEDEANATVRVVLSGPAAAPVSVKIHTSNGTATGGEDFYGFTREVQFAPGDTEQLVPLQIIDDTTDEANESFGLRLFGESGMTVSRRQATVTIKDNDQPQNPPSVSIENLKIGESVGTASILVTLSEAASSSTSVKIATNDGSAQSGQDFYGIFDTLVFAAGETEKQVPITILDDITTETDEIFTVRLFGAVGLSIQNTPATVKIVDNDSAAPPEVSIADASVSEAAGSVDVRVQLSRASTSDTKISAHTSIRTAVSGQDFYGFSRTLTIPAGATEALINVTIVDDAIPEPTEFFAVRLFAESGLTVVRRIADVKIADND